MKQKLLISKREKMAFTVLLSMLKRQSLVATPRGDVVKRKSLDEWPLFKLPLSHSHIQFGFVNRKKSNKTDNEKRSNITWLNTL
jgi:hypothetical protein